MAGSEYWSSDTLCLLDASEAAIFPSDYWLWQVLTAYCIKGLLYVAWWALHVYTVTVMMLWPTCNIMHTLLYTTIVASKNCYFFEPNNENNFVLKSFSVSVQASRLLVSIEYIDWFEIKAAAWSVDTFLVLVVYYGEQMPASSPASHYCM